MSLNPVNPITSVGSSQSPSLESLGVGNSGLEGNSQFQQVLEQAQAQIAIEDYLKYKFQGRKVAVNSADGEKTVGIGMVVSVLRDNEGFNFKIWDGKKAILNAKVVFETVPLLQQNPLDRTSAERQNQQMERYKLENYVNTSPLIELDAQTMPDSVLQPKASGRPIPEKLTFLDNGIESEGYFIVTDDQRLVLNDGSYREVTIRFVQPDDESKAE